MAWTNNEYTRTHQRWTGDAIAANGLNSSSSLNVSAFEQVDVLMKHASHSDTSTWVVQTSQDNGTTWVTISGSNKTTSGASGSDGETIFPLPGGLIRITITEADANGSATLTPYLVLKRSS